MDFRRLILFAALGLVLMMIWQSWIQFQMERDPGLEGPAGAGTTAATGTSGGAPVGSDDVPDAPDVATAAAPAAPEAVAEDTPSGRLIEVETDILRAQIDTRGGDLVRVELLQHPVSVDTPDDPFVLMHRDSGGLYVAQSGLIGNGREFPNHNIEFSTDRESVDLGSEDEVSVTLHWTAPDGVVYRKIYTFHRDSYRIDVDFEVENTAADEWVGFFYGQLKQTEIAQAGSMGFLGRLPSYNGAVIYTGEEKYEKISYDDIAEAPLNVTTDDGWVAMLQHYFVGAWLPEGSAGYQLYTGVSRNTPAPQYRVGFKHTEPVRIAPGESGVVSSALFVGPKEQKRLNELDVDGIVLTVDYGWLTPVAEPLFWLLQKIHDLVGNWGWAIILLTLLVKLIFYPLSAASYKSMAKMKKLQPRLQTLKERYGDDKQKFQQEMMKLYKTEKVNPAGGCLPILVQIPVFIALYWVLLESVELLAGEFRALAPGSVIAGPLFRASRHHGGLDAGAAVSQPGSPGSPAEEDHDRAPHRIYRVLPLVPGWSGTLLGGEQPVVHCAAIRHYTQVPERLISQRARSTTPSLLRPHHQVGAVSASCGFPVPRCGQFRTPSSGLP